MSRPLRIVASVAAVVVVVGGAWLGLRGDDDASDGQTTTSTTSAGAPGDTSPESSLVPPTGPTDAAVDEEYAGKVIDGIKNLFPLVRDSLDDQVYRDMLEHTCAETVRGATEDRTPDVVATMIAAGVVPGASSAPQYTAAMLALSQAYLQGGSCGADRDFELEVRDALLPLASKAFQRDVGPSASP